MAEHNTPLEAVLETVNDVLLDHARGVLRPEDMIDTASCFGRLATVGAGLVVEGVPEDSLLLSISRSHTLVSKSGRFWLGHVMLVVGGPGGTVIDASDRAFVSDKATMKWSSRELPDGGVEVVDLLTLQVRQASFNWDNDEATRRLFSTRKIYEAHPIYTAHPLAEGIARYQEAHPDLNAVRPVTLAEYMAFYTELAARRSAPDAV